MTARTRALVWLSLGTLSAAASAALIYGATCAIRSLVELAS